MTRSLFILFVFSFGFSHAWSGTHGEPFQIEGVIYQEEGVAVRGAEIIVEENGQLIHSVFSDKEGRFRLQLDNLNLSRVNIKVLKRGFESESLLPVSCKKQELHIHLKAKAGDLIPVFHQKSQNRGLSI